MPYKYRPLWLQFTPAVSCLPTTHHCEELSFTLLKTFTQVLEGHLSLFFSRLNNRHSSSISHKAKAHNSSQSWQPSTGIPAVYRYFLCPREGSTSGCCILECQMEWDNCPTCPTGCAPANMRHRLPHAQLSGHHDPQDLLSWAAPRTGCAGTGGHSWQGESQEAPTPGELLKWQICLVIGSRWNG